MPTLLTHPAPAIGMAMVLGRAHVSGRLAAALVIATVLPDLDGIGFKLGIPYDSVLGHRGMTHSLVMALLAGGIGFCMAPILHAKRWVAALLLTLALLSHILLDAMTNGGLGVAVFWPFDNTRYFLPVCPIQVSPLSVRRFLTNGLPVLISEFKWVWLPCLTMGFTMMAYRRYRQPTS